MRLGITVMLCHFARPASVDYRLHFCNEDGGSKIEDGRVKLPTSSCVEGLRWIKWRTGRWKIEDGWKRCAKAFQLRPACGTMADRMWLMILPPRPSSSRFADYAATSRGLFRFHPVRTVETVGYYRPPLRGFQSAPVLHSAGRDAGFICIHPRSKFCALCASLRQ